MNMFAEYDKTKPDTEKYKRLKLEAVKLTTVQVVKLLLWQKAKGLNRSVTCT